MKRLFSGKARKHSGHLYDVREFFRYSLDKTRRDSFDSKIQEELEEDPDKPLHSLDELKEIIWTEAKKKNLIMKEAEEYRSMNMTVKEDLSIFFQRFKKAFRLANRG